jgi:hypothetical protein
MYKETIVGKTKAGKKLAYSVKPNESLYTIHFTTGGQIPESLSGYWNDQRQIVQAITTYLNKDKLCKPDQEKKDYKKSIAESKKRPNKLKHKKAS